MRPMVRTPRLRPLVLAAMLVVAAAAAVAADDDAVTQGALRYTDPDSGEARELPLEHTDVLARVSGTVAEVTVTQRFANPLGTRLEAVYVFPLPDRAAVDDMSMKIGERVIRGEIHRREEARRIYDEAVARGHLAGLLDQERPNIFTQRVANLSPGEAVEVVIHYVEDLHFDHGTWRMVFPTVVGPRYVPGRPVGRTGDGWSPDTDRVPDASRITPPVLRPGERSGHDISIRVELAPGFAIRALGSSSHEIVTGRPARNHALVELAPRDRIPNKDFVLTWSTAAAAVESAVVAHRTDELGYLTLILQPPAEPRPEQVVPREVVFVIDSSGSMSGEPIAACKQLVRRALRGLGDDDTFRLIRFAGDSSVFDPDALPPTRANLERALSWLDGLRGGGGTEMLAGVRAALEAPKDPYRLRMVMFLTDGYIGNETEILGRVGEVLGDARIFAFGIGSSVNRYLLDRLAEAGRGVAEYLRPGEPSDVLVSRFSERITDPVFTQLELDWGGLEVVDVEPAALPDLFAGQPLEVHARYRSGGRGTVTLRGWAGTRRLELQQRVDLPSRTADNAAQARLWARSRIARLEMAKVRAGDSGPLVEEITELALAHRLMTAYTSFVAVDRSTVRDDGELVTIDQPVPMPEGVSYEGVFGQGPAVAVGKKVEYRQVGGGQGAGGLRPDERAPHVLAVGEAPPAQRVIVADPSPPRSEPIRSFARDEQTRGAGREVLDATEPAPARPEAVREQAAETVLPPASRTDTGTIREIPAPSRPPVGSETEPAPGSAPPSAAERPASEPVREGTRPTGLLVHLPSLTVAGAVLLVALLAWAVRRRVLPV